MHFNSLRDQHSSKDNFVRKLLHPGCKNALQFTRWFKEEICDCLWGTKINRRMTRFSHYSYSIYFFVDYESLKTRAV